MKEIQISFSAKNHALDNNDNFSPDGKFLCYDTRGTVYNSDLANCKSIEKIEISSGKETVLWAPESVTGEKAAPGVAAVSYHPHKNKVVFIHGPLLDEVAERGYYGIRNRTGVVVSADGKGVITKVDMRDVATNRPTTPGAQRGGTHRHEYSRNGKRIGFTYDDFILQDYDRTIGYMIPHVKVPKGYTHYFALLVKPVEKGKSKPGEIEKAYGDSWVDSEGKMRAFVGKVRAQNGTDYKEDLFVAAIPDEVDITTAKSGDGKNYPDPPDGVRIRRLTHDGDVSGIVRGTNDGKWIAYLQKDGDGISQVMTINTNGSDLSDNPELKPKQLSSFSANAGSVRWHPSGNWVFAITNGNIAALCTQPGKDFGKTIMLTNDELVRSNLVVSPNGKMLACNMFISAKNNTGREKEYMQIVVMNLDAEKMKEMLLK